MEKIQFPVLKVDGSNYLMWALNAEIVLSMKLLSDIIVDDTNIDEQDKARATFIIRHHLDKDLQGQYLTAISPSELWQSLKRRFDHLRLISLPSARNEWMTLRVLDHPTIASYNSALFRITSQLSACGQPVSEADQIERTLSTFPPTNMQLAQVYRQMNFRQYSDLIAVMLLAEKNDLLLLHNSRARPAGTLSKPETQYASTSKPDRPPFRPRPPFRGYKGKRPFRPQPNRSFKGRPFNKTQPNNRNRDQKKTTLQCFKCGSPGHIQRDCRIPQHLVKLYQDSLPSSSSVTASNYMEIEEDLTLYTRPETHLVTYPATTPGEIPSPIHGDTCILDSGTSHSILRDPKYFHKLTPSNRPVTTITGIDHLEEAQGPATVILPNRTLIEISSAIYAPGATRNLLSFQDIRANNLHIRTSPHPHSDSLQIYTDTPEGIVIHETLGSHPPGLYATHIESHYNENQRISPTEIWHRRLGHPGTSMFHRILKDSRGIPPTVHPSSTRDTCIACAEGKLKIQPAISKIIRRIPAFLEEISIDVCGPISPPSGPFRYFMGMVCASSKWSQTSLLSTRNLVMARILTHIIRLKSQFPESPIRILCIDNAGEFQSPPFHRFCDTLGITIRYSVPYVHFQNGGAEAFMKTIQLIARPLLMQSALPPTAWGHAVIHGAALLKFRPSAFNNLTPHHLAHGTTPDLSHLKIFGCLALIPILGPNQTKMGPQRRKGIYVGYDSPSVIRYLDPSTADLFRARFQDCQFREDIFPTLQTTNPANKPATHKLNWQTEDATWQDQRTNMTNDEVNKILHLHQIMQDLPDAFNDAARVTKSHVEAANVPARIITTGHIMNRDNLQRKRRNPPGPTTHHKSKKRSTLFTAHAPPRPDKQVENEEISLNYTETGDILTRNEIEPDEGFATYISQIINSEDPDPRSVEEARKRDDWPHWETAIQDELDSLIERRVFGKLCPAPPDLHLTGYRITLVRKRDAQGNVARYKARLVAKGYTQIFGTDYDMTHAPVMDSITYRYLMSFSLQHHLRLHLMDVVTAYLYGTLDNSIHMQAPPELIERALFHIKGRTIERYHPNSKKE